MKIDLEKYPNLLDQIELSSGDIQKQVSSLKLNFDQVRLTFVETKMKLPTFLDFFYDLVLNDQKIPGQLEFWEYYKKQSNVESMDKSGKLMKGIKARVLRTFPSLIRDIHFAVLLKERSINSSIVYNKDLDVIYGIDIVVLFRKQYFGLNLYIDSTTSKRFKKKKKYRHEEIENIEVVNLPISFTDNHLCGEVYLYGEEEIAMARQAILKRCE